MNNNTSQNREWVSIESERPQLEDKVLVLQQNYTPSGNLLTMISMAYYLTDRLDLRKKAFYPALSTELEYGEWDEEEFILRFPANSISPQKTKKLMFVTHWAPLPEIEEHHLLKIKK